MNPVGQVISDVKTDLGELMSSVAGGVAKASTDVAKETIEQVSGAPSQASTQQLGGGTSEQGQAKTDPSAVKRQEETKRFNEVKNELVQYIQRKKQLDAQIAQEKSQEEQQKKQEGVFKKQEKESYAQQLIRKIGGASHGETSKQKE